MDSRDELFHHRVEGIIAELSRYFEIRYSMLTRIKPSLASMYADLLWQQMEKVRTVMAHEKMFGPVRLRVGDILASRDHAKRAAVMGPIDQASILNELVPEQEESAERRPGMVAVRNMRALFTSVDPSLGPVIELTDIWLWWDTPDAADTFNFSEQKNLIQRLRTEDVSQAVQDYYHQALGIRDDRALSREEILSYEYGYLQSIWKGFMQRRAEEQSFMMVIKRDPIGGGDSLDDLIVAMGRHIAARQRLAQEDGLDDRLRDYYAKILKCKPSDVTPERATAQEDLTLLRLREDLRAGLERGAVLGEPYDYKKAQGELMRRDLEHYRQELPLVEAVVAASARPAAVAAAAPAAGPPAPAAAPQRIAPRPQPAEKPLGEQETLADEGPLLL